MEQPGPRAHLLLPAPVSPMLFWGKTGTMSIWAVAGPHRAPCLSARYNAGIIRGVCPSCFHMEPEGSPRLVNQGRAGSSASEGSKLGGREENTPLQGCFKELGRCGPA